MFHFFRSLRFFIGNFFIKRTYDVVFYYPAHFNRGNDNKNEFFEPLYRLCEKNGIKYIVFEEPEFGKKVPRNPDTIPFDYPMFFILLLRKLIPLSHYSSFQQRDWKIAKIVKPLFFRKFSFENYIVLSNSMLAFFRGLEPKAHLYDYQHGVIYSNHIGYFTRNSEAPPHIKENDANLLLYGKGFQDVLVQNTSDNYYRTHTFPLGSSKRIERRSVQKNTSGTILFSLQFTGEEEWNGLQYKWFEAICNFVEKNSPFFEKKDIEIVMKHHPRFNGFLDMSQLQKYDFISFSDDNLMDLLENSFLHMTMFSSTIFEASAVGVPTLLWDEPHAFAAIYVDDFDYPLGMIHEEYIAEKIENYLYDEKSYAKDAASVLSWYENIFSPIDEKLFLKLFKSEM